MVDMVRKVEYIKDIERGNTMYHGATTCTHTANGWAPHAGACYTDNLAAAMAYAGRDGVVYIVEIDTSDAIELDGYDRDTDTAAGDADLAALPGDLVTYADEDEYGRQHNCWRVVTDNYAVRVIRSITVQELVDNDIEDSFDLENYLA